MRKFAKFWRDSASLIILAKDGAKVVPNNEYDYKILVFKRSEKTAFMPNSIVFPGGAFDKNDETMEWYKLYNKFGISDLKIKEVMDVEQGQRPFIFENSGQNTIDRNVSLRLTSIREAFEELGVLFCKTKQDLEHESSSCYSKTLSNFDIHKWQKAVHDHEKRFIDLCDHLEVVPDIWRIYEWSAWLTPSMFRKRRFETAFYLVALNEKPEVVPEEHEVQEYMWETPKSLLEAHKGGKLWLAPPQMYEIARLSHLYRLDDVVKFAKQRNSKGSTLFYPVQFKCSDGFVHVLPGDDLYPENPNYTSENEDFNKYESITCEELRSKTKKLHRTEHNSLHDAKLYLNHEPLNSHLHPLEKDYVNLSKL